MKPVPRVNSKYLNHYHNTTVKLLCKVIKFDGDTALVLAPDQGQVTVHLNPDSNWSEQFVEVTGKVGEDGSIKELFSCSWKVKDIDAALEIADKAVKLTHEYPDLYPTTE